MVSLSAPQLMNSTSQHFSYGEYDYDILVFLQTVYQKLTFDLETIAFIDGVTLVIAAQHEESVGILNFECHQ